MDRIPRKQSDWRRRSGLVHHQNGMGAYVHFYVIELQISPPSVGRQEPPCSVPDHIIFQPTFQTRSHRLDQRCLSPLPLIGAPSDWCPCKDENMICVRPSPEAQILRIRADGRTILWHGERSDILRHISVGMWKARGWKSLVHWLTAFAE